MPKIFIVSRGYTEMYEQLGRALSGEPEVAIIYDRRDPTSQRPRRKASIWSLRPLGGVRDRRTPSHVDFDLRFRGWAVATVAEATPIDEVIGGLTDPSEIGHPPARRTPQRHREGTGAPRPEMLRTGNAETVAGHRRWTQPQPSMGAGLFLVIALAVLLNIALFIIIVKLLW